VAVSLLDTDLEADVTPSAEFLEGIEAEREAVRLTAEQQARLEAEDSAVRFVSTMVAISLHCLFFFFFFFLFQAPCGCSCLGCK
jgi:hypothetical protein